MKYVQNITLLKNFAGVDTVGGVRVPAAFCGILGFRSSYGLVTNAGIVPVSTSLDAVGTYLFYSVWICKTRWFCCQMPKISFLVQHQMDRGEYVHMNVLSKMILLHHFIIDITYPRLQMSHNADTQFCMFFCLAMCFCLFVFVYFVFGISHSAQASATLIKAAHLIVADITLVSSNSLCDSNLSCRMVC